MNRVIKFRVWDTELNIWINNIGMGVNNTLTKGTEKRFHVMQFTGLKDVNGTDIYECDILKVGENLTCEIIYIDTNVQDMGDEVHGAYHAKIYQHNKIIPLDSYLLNNCTVIGNIYENKELILNK